VIEQHEFEPHCVGVEVAEREVLKAAVFGGADAIFDAGALRWRRSRTPTSPSGWSVRMGCKR
jgi:hypothetical protein